MIERGGERCQFLFAHTLQTLFSTDCFLTQSYYNQFHSLISDAYNDLNYTRFVLKSGVFSIEYIPVFTPRPGAHVLAQALWVWGQLARHTFTLYHLCRANPRISGDGSLARLDQAVLHKSG